MVLIHKDSSHRHVCNCWLINNMSYIICRYVYYLFRSPISNYSSFTSPNPKYTFHTVTILLFWIQQKFNSTTFTFFQDILSSIILQSYTVSLTSLVRLSNITFIQSFVKNSQLSQKWKLEHTDTHRQFGYLVSLLFRWRRKIS